MNLRSIANQLTSQINPNVTVTLQPSIGYGIGIGRKQTPSYGPPITVQAQIQALDNGELQLISGLNLQGDLRTIILNGVVQGAIREDNKGGDLILWNTQTWLIVKVLETWPDWTKAVMLRQVA